MNDEEKKKYEYKIMEMENHISSMKRELDTLKNEFVAIKRENDICKAKMQVVEPIFGGK